MDPGTGDSHWVFESAEEGSRTENATDKRFFWLALYVQPVLWIGLAIFATIFGHFIWLSLIGESRLNPQKSLEALTLTVASSHRFDPYHHKHSRILQV